MIGHFLQRETIDVPCTIEIENTLESLHAHVELDGGLQMNAGDEVLCTATRCACPTAKSACCAASRQ